MPDPITIKTREPIGYKTVGDVWSYDRILEIFPDGDNDDLVNPLVRRCQQYEKEIERLRKELAEALEVPCELCQKPVAEQPGCPVCWDCHAKERRNGL